MNTEQIQLEVLKKYFEHGHPISGHHIDSYNWLIEKGLQQIIEQEPPINTGETFLRFVHIDVQSPNEVAENRALKPLYPHDARITNSSYSGAIYVTIVENDREGNVLKRHERIMIGKLPIMLGCSKCNLRDANWKEKVEHNECPNDFMGQFIIKGHERVLVSQSSNKYNTTIVQKRNDDSFVAEIRSRSNETMHTVLIQCMIDENDKNMVFSLPFIKECIPIGIVFKALGFSTRKEMSDLIGISDEIIAEFPIISNYINYVYRESSCCRTQKEALEYIGSHRINIPDKKKNKDLIKYAWQVIETEMFPHLGISGSIKEQACFLGTIVRSLLLVKAGYRIEDGKDNYANKCIEAAGTLVAEIFRNLFKKMHQTLVECVNKHKQCPDLVSIIQQNKIITRGLEQCFATGKWCVQRNAKFFRTGVSQIADRMSYMSFMSHLRRIVLPMGKKGKNVEIRRISPTQVGVVCPFETPEGQQVGVVLNMAVLCTITTDIEPTIIKQIVEKSLKKHLVFARDVELSKVPIMTKLMINNVLFAFVNDPEKLVQKLRKMRIRQEIPFMVSIGWNRIDNCIKIFCDEGRFIRPLFVVKNNQLKIESIDAKNLDSMSFMDLIRNDYIRHVDSYELEHESVVAISADLVQKGEYDYCEIHPSVIMGYMCNLIPFVEHNQGARITFGSGMGRQGISIPRMNYLQCAETMLSVLNYLQRNIVDTVYGRLTRNSEMACGANVIVMIKNMGDNQEDAVVINKGFVDRGGFDITYRKTISDVEKKHSAYITETICIPPATNLTKPEHPGYFRRAHDNYSLLDENGIVRTRMPLIRLCQNPNCDQGEFTNNDKMNRKCPSCSSTSYSSYGGGSVHVTRGDVIIGKIITQGSKNGAEKVTDVSRVIQTNEEGYVDKVIVTTNSEGYKIVKIVIRNMRHTQKGDKFSSRFAQKGICGAIWSEENMPFTSDGLRPDIVINPLCMPGRMTIGQLIEMLLGKKCVTDCEFGDATAFSSNSYCSIGRIMKEIESTMEEDENGKFVKTYKFTPDGNETVYCGITGKMFPVRIFTGVAYYSRLKHMVDDKMHSRAQGQMTAVNRQPTEGRSRNGGLRFGEMERDCIISQGAASMLVERLCRVSDPFQIPVCRNCGVIPNRVDICQDCNCTLIDICPIPYATKLMFHQLMAMTIGVRFTSEHTLQLR